MRLQFALLSAAIFLASTSVEAQRVEEVRTPDSETPVLPEDLFRLPPGTWTSARQLWSGDEPCTADECEAGYTSGDVVVSVERQKTYLRVVAGFRGCQSVAWNEYKIGKKASGSDTKTIARRIKKTVGASAKYCKVEAPTIAALDARQLFPAPPPPSLSTPAGE